MHTNTGAAGLSIIARYPSMRLLFPNRKPATVLPDRSWLYQSLRFLALLVMTELPRRRCPEMGEPRSDSTINIVILSQPQRRRICRSARSKKGGCAKVRLVGSSMADPSLLSGWQLRQAIVARPSTQFPQALKNKAPLLKGLCLLKTRKLTAESLPVHYDPAANLALVHIAVSLVDLVQGIVADH